MKLKNIFRQAIFLFIFSLFFSQSSFSQCFKIESILVDACEPSANTEGLNEMVRFKVGNVAINTSNIDVDWPSNGWFGLVQNATTASKVASLNATIQASGGCGQVLQPTGGVLPANATVILVTSHNFNITSNTFGALTDTIYILFQNSTLTGGHFGNYGNSGNNFRTLKISFGGCSDTVTYNRSLLVDQNGQNVAADGATVVFTPSGTASYINNGCVAPVQPFTVDATPASASTCAGNSISLTGTAQGHQSVLWSAPNGTFSNATALSTTFTPAVSSAGSTVQVTLTATNTCGATISDVVNVTVTSGITPNFDITPLAICIGSSVPTLNTTSPNGISGIWSPSAISNTASGSYVFTPNAGQCASPVTLNVTITNSIIPNFDVTPLTICNGSSVPTLNTTSPNGISGTWSPSVISNTASGNYVFTPNSGQCASPVTLNVTITNSIIPNFDITPLAICNGSSGPALNTTSPNGISGTWSPSAISNTASGNYVFTPNAGQCASPVTLIVTIINSIVPNFDITPLTICNGSSVPALNTTSPNGISGTWSPSAISNTASGNYVFTPNSGQCASPVTLSVTVTNSIVPNFDITPLAICNGSSVPTLNTTSPNGISGTWNPSAISNTTSGNYVFTPNAGQCASPVTLNVTITNSIVPNFDITPLTICSGSSVPTLNMTSPNGISGTWSPSAISNTASGNYVFTPNSGQCASPVTLSVTVTNSIVPNFDITPLAICNGSSVPTLNTTSPNGISGTWNPSAISNTTSGNYVFTPNAGQCASPVTLNVTITNSIIPNFDLTPLTICNGSSVPTLNTTSPNGLSGTWSPSAISNTASGSYVFTPNAGQCASPVTLNVTINNVSLTAIDGPNSVCISDTIQLTNTTQNGTWSSSNSAIATVDTNGNVTGISAGNVVITYSIGGGSCGSVSKTVRVYALPIPILEDGFVCKDNETGAIISSVSLHSGLSNTNFSFIWTLNDVVLPTTSNTHLAIEPGVYEVTATNILTGCAASASATIGISSIASAEATVGRDFDRNQTITVNVTGGSGNYEFQLDNGLPQTSNIFYDIREGEYEITVRDTQGCGVINLTVYALNYPYYFTPNSDGYHDTWNIKGLSDQPNAVIYIFDRYGKLLKEIKPSPSSGWDGMYNGHALPSTDYWFKLLYQSRDGNQKEFKAHFSMKR